ncbi:hypothetical protein N8T08_002509 [Aspergillus melleus]|uniref:Uncharacterized protein n=1 Tax=Aspergillus melleus TaxID=138277 RepID=A0ACC3ALS6_9EURO|nr:hypothetical protein N8T08_002509 [Aspergillus melleus]
MDGVPWDKGRVITCGYSAQATIYAMILGGVMITVALIRGSRRFKSSMPLALYCSAAISAACHLCTDNEHALLPVKWGEIVVKSSPSSSIHSDQEKSRYGAARECSSSVSDHESLDAGEEARLSGGTNVEPSATRNFHCSFTSGEVVKLDITRDYI